MQSFQSDIIVECVVCSLTSKVEEVVQDCSRRYVFNTEIKDIRRESPVSKEKPNLLLDLAAA